MRATFAAVSLALCACVGAPLTPSDSGADHFLVIAGERVPTEAPVVPWFAPGGFNAYRTEPFFGAEGESGLRYHPGRKHPAWNAAATEAEGVRDTVDLFVLHYDVCGTSERCFRVLHDQRGLSVHFLLDADGTLYQTLDLQEQAWHARQANPRSIGIEITQIGAYPLGATEPLERWYDVDEDGVRLAFPKGVEPPGAPGRVFRPARGERIVGEVHGATFEQYDFTDEQYASLAQLARTLLREFPRLRPDAPRDANGSVRTDALTDAEFEAFSGFIGHSHISRGKRDPGPAFDWERFLGGLRPSP